MRLRDAGTNGSCGATNSPKIGPKDGRFLRIGRFGLTFRRDAYIFIGFAPCGG
jgi:hypothetical protein